MPEPPLAYFITYTTYGTWLQGREQGWVDRDHNQFGTPIPQGNPERERLHRQAMRQPPYHLDEPHRQVVLRTILEVAQHRLWMAWAVHVRSNHVHAVVTAATNPEKVMSDFKAWSSRRLREACREPAERDRWTQHGSTRYLWTPESVAQAVKYVAGGQGEPMAVYVHPDFAPK